MMSERSGPFWDAIEGRAPMPRATATLGLEIYFATEDVDGVAEKVRAAGGQIHMGPEDMPEVGRMAVLADPQGAAFGVVNPPSQNL